ncbi:MAG: SAM-dependent methyltransferase [Salinivirgaceae bacterium]|nr:MAG: SAM-dependent methyltransferase [Salinivirgaceae bacterium]
MVRKRFLIHRSGCAVCGEPLEYRTTFNTFQCYYCDKEFQSEVSCHEGHYVCDDCHRIDANDFITSSCLKYTDTNPIELANQIMAEPIISIHGPEHHYLVPAVLITCYRNHIGESHLVRADLTTLRQKMVKIPGNICGTHGGCGAVLGLGAFVSHVTSTTTLSTKSWAHVHAVTGAGLLHVSKYGGPRCCKRDTYISLLEGITWLREYKEIELKKSETIYCEFSGKNKECLHKGCLFHSSQAAS